ncbi:hypothetical protein J4439_00310 [Candidatus Woesearchaeota archaeon]|nr:hypothetical protein [Candidatus Woesearchaeota archaeon]
MTRKPSDLGEYARSLRTKKEASKPAGAVPPAGRNILQDIAGKHLRKRYLNSREHVEDSVLLIPDKRLLTLTGRDAERYRAALQDILGREVADESFRIDKGGSALGYDLDDWLIIVSPQQRECDIISDEFSFMEQLLSEVHAKAGPLIQQVTLGEALYGRVTGPALTPTALIASAMLGEGGLSLSVTLETPTRALEAFAKLHRVVQDAKEDYRSILSAETQQAVLDAFTLKYGAEGSRPGLGNLRLIRPDGVFPVKMQSASYKLRGDSMDLYSLTGTKPLMVYFQHGAGNGESRRTEQYAVVNGRETDDLLDALIREGFLFYSASAGRERLQTLRRAARQAEAGDLKSAASVSDLFRRVDSARAPETVRELEEAIAAIEGARDEAAAYGHFSSCSGDVKLSMVYPVRKDPVLFDLLSRMQDQDPDVVRYRSTGEAIAFIEKAGDQMVGEWLRAVSSRWSYADEQNPWVNLYLAETRPGAVELAGLQVEKR